MAAEGLGLGSVIIGVIKGAMSGGKQDYFAKALKFPENYEFEIAIAVGHKAVEKEPHEYDMKRNVSYNRVRPQRKEKLWNCDNRNFLS